VNPLIILALTFGGFALAYFTYGRYLARRIFHLRGDAQVPSRALEDGVDYVPTRRGIIFGHHFTSIAGTGPIVGPAIGVLFGWIPALIWIFLGSIFLGAVHDLGAMVVSLRHEGRSIADIVSRYISRRVRVICFLIVFLELWIVIAVFGLVIANLFHLFPQSVAAIWLQIPIAIWLGLMVYRLRGSVALSTFLAVLFMYVTILFGAQLPLDMPDILGVPATGIWTLILLVYCYAASTLPVQLLLQPRDYINAWQLFIMLLLLALGAVASSLTGGLRLAAPAYSPGLGVGVLGSMFPFLFVTIACGAISGFHSLVCSGTSAKQISDERDALFVGYGAMLLEGALATLILIAVAAGIGMGYQTAAGAPLLFGNAAWKSHYADPASASSLGGTVRAVVTGSANMMRTIGVPTSVGLAIMGVFIASFAGTTLDTATRIQRYVIAELAQEVRLRALANRWIATAVAVVSAGVLAFSTGWSGKGAMILWPMFGAVNQLLAALALLLVTLYLRRRGGLKYLVTLLPCLFMLVMTISAMAINEKRFVGEALASMQKAGAQFPFGRWLLASINGAALLLSLWMVVEGFIVLWRPTTPAGEGDRDGSDHRR